MLNKRLMNARDLVTKSEYGEVDGKKIVVATVYSSASLGLEERVEREEPASRTPKSRGATTLIEEKKE